MTAREKYIYRACYFFVGRNLIIFTIEMGVQAVTKRGDPSARGQGVFRRRNERIAWNG
jgi:hypothetical protein